ncbi:uncharacterized protein NDAI_0D03890 [Naumovozyma dairenensis CBS 421]|uniref:Uncharacterized protein n=1 Tax=Naumovozyma dairenensis (strain ATCC 10597 / BCRC 20456 / CBS 421 / NBRC 0211 / NRRL Y-12639) TaxID=1071378 RepID=G0WA92_NAUDC|nr:hypothetical protein NDAI_0D03890 [Naumovozyma dairenensis CBS 421]CCD24703.1 hypothetical protein NDAI_0D03890 [Naumovozyma dairenensis CBS 421]
MTTIPVYKCSLAEVIHAYTTTPKYLIVAQSTLNNPFEVHLHYSTHADSGIVVPNKTFKYPIHISRRITPGINYTTTVKRLEITETPILEKSKKALKTIVYNLIIVCIDGIRITTLENLVEPEYSQLNEWVLPNKNDSISSFYCQSRKNGTIEIVLGTTFCSIVHLLFYIETGTFRNLDLQKGTALYTIDELISDSVVSICGLRSPSKGSNFPCTNENELITRNSFTDALSVATVDGKVHIVSKNKSEVHDFLESILPDENKEHNVTAADSVIAKEFMNSSLIFVVANITNVGCIIFEKSKRRWEQLEILERDHNAIEDTPLLDHILSLNVDMNEFIIYSGSVNGKLYQWTYNYKDYQLISSSVFEENIYNVVHSISMEGNARKLFFIHNDDTCINYIQL